MTAHTNPALAWAWPLLLVLCGAARPAGAAAPPRTTAGEPAGGCLSLMAGVCVRPRPRALVAYWGYGDVDGAWYTQPSAFYRKLPLVSKDEAERAVGGKVLTATEGGTPAQQARGRFYL